MRRRWLGRLPDLAGPARGIAVALSLAVLPAPAVLATTYDAHILPRKPIAAPSGFKGVCARYSWACARSGAAVGAPDLGLVRAVNRAVNRKTRPLSDRRQYGSDEVWALPTSSGGDCEDIVLLKKRELVSQGFPPEALLIATVLDRRRMSHAVLVLRTGDVDLVLDNLRDQILPWRKTGYSFMRMQNPTAPHRWNAVLAGGEFN